MKRQGRRWGKVGGLAMVKIITVLRNRDLSCALTSRPEGCSKPQSPDLSRAVRNALKKAKFVPHVGVRHGAVYNGGPTSSAVGQLQKMFAC